MSQNEKCICFFRPFFAFEHRDEKGIVLFCKKRKKKRRERKW